MDHAEGSGKTRTLLTYLRGRHPVHIGEGHENDKNELKPKKVKPGACSMLHDMEMQADHEEPPEPRAFLQRLMASYSATPYRLPTSIP